MSSLDLAMEFNKPISGEKIKHIPNNIPSAQAQLQARRKLASILKFKSTKETSITAGGLIEVFNKTDMEKNGTWSVLKIVLSMDKDGCTVAVLAKDGKLVVVWIESIIITFPQNSFAVAVQKEIESVGEPIHGNVENDERYNQCNNIQDSEETAFKTVTACNDDAYFSDEKSSIKRRI